VTSDRKPSGFNEILSHCVEEGLTEALGSTIVDALFDQMYEHYDITLENLPNRLDKFFSVLEGAMGQKVSQVLSRVIARKLYANLSLEFVEKPMKGLPEYVEEIRKKLATS
jgi:flagellar biosynthesis/type III secretory pathway protein FliH